MPQAPWLLASLLLCACSSVAWQPRPNEEVWRGTRLWCAPNATIAAREESTAAAVLERFDELRAAMLAAGETPPPSPPLLLVVDNDDPPLLGDPVLTLRTMAKWHNEAIATPASPTPSSQMNPQIPPDASPSLLAAMAKMLSAAVPLHAPELALPPQWQQLARWAVVVPSDHCLDAAASTLLDEGLAKADVGWGKRVLMAPLLQWIRSKMRAAFQGAAWRQLLDASCSPAVLGREVPWETKQRVLLALGVTDDLPPPDTAQLKAVRPNGEGRRAN